MQSPTLETSRLPVLRIESTQQTMQIGLQSASRLRRKQNPDILWANCTNHGIGDLVATARQLSHPHCKSMFSNLSDSRFQAVNVWTFSMERNQFNYIGSTTTCNSQEKTGVGHSCNARRRARGDATKLAGFTQGLSINNVVNRQRTPIGYTSILNDKHQIARFQNKTMIHKFGDAIS